MCRCLTRACNCVPFFIFIFSRFLFRRDRRDSRTHSTSKERSETPKRSSSSGRHGSSLLLSSSNTPSASSKRQPASSEELMEWAKLAVCVTCFSFGSGHLHAWLALYGVVCVCGRTVVVVVACVCVCVRACVRACVRVCVYTFTKRGSDKLYYGGSSYSTRCLCCCMCSVSVCGMQEDGRTLQDYPAAQHKYFGAHYSVEAVLVSHCCRLPPSLSVLLY